jgi:uncharacterized tellurite resistance protein B-like protein
MTMLNRIKDLFAAPERAVGSHESVHLAAAVLMVEAAYMDQDFDSGERRTITDILKSHFTLSDDEVADLLAHAEQIHNDTNQLLRFTRAIKDGYAQKDRVKVVEMLWEVAYSDGTLHDYEANLLRRVCGLIYVSDRDSGLARKRVLDRLGLNGAPPAS